MTLEELQLWLESQIAAVDAMERENQSAQTTRDLETARSYYKKILEKSREVVCKHPRAAIVNQDDRADVEYYPFCPDCGRFMVTTDPTPTLFTDAEKYHFLKRIAEHQLLAIAYRYKSACAFGLGHVDNAIIAAMVEWGAASTWEVE